LKMACVAANAAGQCSWIMFRGFRLRFTPGYSKVAASAAAFQITW
jgi:hypothetical protein